MTNKAPKNNTHWKIAVVKFGGSFLTKTNDIPEAVHEVYRYLRKGYRVLAVVSAMDNTKNQSHFFTMDGVDKDHVVPPTSEFAELVSTGEIAAACLFSIGLDNAGIKAKRLHHQCLLTKNSLLNGEPESLTTDLIFTLFERYSVLVLPGAIGYDKTKSTALLGMRGADYTAIYAAWCLQADDCVIYKDTDGIYGKEVNGAETSPQRYESIHYVDLLKLPSSIIHHKALKFAEANQVSFHVTSLKSIYKTDVGPLPSIYASTPPATKKLKIMLLGLGTVGMGVYNHLLANQHLFEVVGILVHDLNKHRCKQLPKNILANDWATILARQCDVVIELTGGIELPETIIRQAISQKCHVITANRALMAEKGKELCQLAIENKVHLLYSAAVGGAIPILENLQQIREAGEKNPIQSITGVLNSACNFILDKIKEGSALNNTFSLAKMIGLTQGDATIDLYGFDATQKATLISRAAFGRDPDTIDRVGIQSVDEMTIRNATDAGKNIRLVINCALKDDKVHVKIEPIALDINHPLGQVTDVHNAILIHTHLNDVIELHGKGAGRGPGAESVFADLLALSEQAHHHSPKENPLEHNQAIPAEFSEVNHDLVEEMV